MLGAVFSSLGAIIRRLKTGLSISRDGSDVWDVSRANGGNGCRLWDECTAPVSGLRSQCLGHPSKLMALSLHFFCAYSATIVWWLCTWGVAPGCKLLRLQRVLPTRGCPWHHGHCPSPSLMAVGPCLQRALPTREHPQHHGPCPSPSPP